MWTYRRNAAAAMANLCHEHAENIEALVRQGYVICGGARQHM